MAGVHVSRYKTDISNDLTHKQLQWQGNEVQWSCSCYDWQTWYGMERWVVCDHKSNTPSHIHLRILTSPFWLVGYYIFIYSLQESRSQEDEKLQSDHPVRLLIHACVGTILHHMISSTLSLRRWLLREPLFSESKSCQDYTGCLKIEEFGMFTPASTCSFPRSGCMSSRAYTCAKDAEVVAIAMLGHSLHNLASSSDKTGLASFLTWFCVSIWLLFFGAFRMRRTLPTCQSQSL